MGEALFTNSAAAAGDAPTGPLQFDCPRCGSATEAAYWGPCPGCREELARTLHRDAQEVTVADYEPKMNVTPNQVATKD